MAMVRQMNEMNVIFPFVFMLYASQPQFLAMGPEANYIFSHTLYHPNINWDVTDGLTRAEMEERYWELFPNVEYEPDFQTALAYGAGVITEKLIEMAGSFDPADLKRVALELSGEVVVMSGPYAIDETGKQTAMQNVVMQNTPDGPQVTYPAAVKTAEPVFPIPAWDER